MLKGNEVPALVHVPLVPLKSGDFREGVDYFPDLPPSFNTVTGYDACNVKFTPEELSGQTSENQ